MDQTESNELIAPQKRSRKERKKASRERRAAKDQTTYVARSNGLSPGLSIMINDEHSRHWAHSDGGTVGATLRQSREDYLLITPFHRQRPRAVNMGDFVSLWRNWRGRLGKDAQATWVIAHWTVASLDETGKLKQVCDPLTGGRLDAVEYSWLVWRPSTVSSQHWQDFAFAFASELNGGCFVLQLDGRTTLRTQGGLIKQDLSTGADVEAAWQSLARQRAGSWTDRRSSYFLGGKGKPHPFKLFIASRGNISSRMMFAYNGIR